MVQFSRRKRQRIESTLIEYELWMTAGRDAFARHQHLQPHRRVSLGTAARLVDVASLFGRLACGLELHPGKLAKDAEPPCTEAISFEDTLKRVYGERVDEKSPAVAM